MKFEFIDPSKFDCWDKKISHHFDSEIFHSSSWARVLKYTYRFRPHYLLGIDVLESNHTVLGLPLMEVNSLVTGTRGISLPFSDFCPPLAANAEILRKGIEEILKKIAAKKWRYLELRGHGPGFRKEQAFAHYFTHTLELYPEPQKIFESFSSTTRRNIRKSERSNLRIVFSHDWESVKNYYKLHCLTRKRHGIPPQPLKFFKQIHRWLILPGKGITATVYKDFVPLASAIFLFHGGKALYKFGASDYRYQKLRPNNFLMWKSIDQFAKAGYAIFHFGRTEPGNRGLLRFKRGWGTREDRISYFRIDADSGKFITSLKSNGSSSLMRFFKLIMSNMPTLFLRIAGSVIYRHVA